MSRQFLLLGIFLTLISCGSNTELTSSDKAQIIDEVKQTLNNYYDDIRKSGLEAEFSYLDNSEDFFWVPPGYTKPASYEEIVTAIKGNAARFRKVDNAFENLQVIPLTKDLATYSGKLHSVMTDTAGQTMQASLVETGLMIRRQDGWKLLSGQTTVLNQ